MFVLGILICIEEGPFACGKACMRAKGDSEDVFEDDEVLRTVVIKKRTLFDRDACLSWK
jgi:hypothetical protein